MGTPALRIFHPGKRVDYALQILNPQEDHSTKQPQLESQLFLFAMARKSTPESRTR